MEFDNLKNTYYPIGERLLGIFLKIPVWYHLGFSGLLLFDKISHQLAQKSDAIILLQGDQLDRAGSTLQAYQYHLAPVVLISGNNDLIGRGKRNDENDFHLLELKKELVKQGVVETSIT